MNVDIQLAGKMALSNAPVQWRLQESILWYGNGYCPGHFGELMQGKFSLKDGAAVRGLVTLPCRKVGAIACVKIRKGSGNILVPPGKHKVLKVVEAYCQFHGIEEDIDIEVELQSTIPSGIGMGSSTADIVSTIRALDQALGKASTGSDITCLTLIAERACDSTMYNRSAVLFAQRSGFVIEDYEVPITSLIVHGFDMMPGEQFLTDETPPAEYTNDEIKAFDQLRRRLRGALLARDVAALGGIATESAVINQRFFPKPHFSDLLDLHRRFKSLGICISHSGTISGLLFPASGYPSGVDRAHVDHMAREIGIRPIGQFSV